MAVTLDIFYLDNVVPLVSVNVDELELGQTYITGDGSRIEVIEDESGGYDVVLKKQSPLNDGERVSTLTESGAKLLFKFLNHKES